VTATAIGTERVSDLVREAGESRRPLRIRGAGLWLEAGRRVQASTTLSLAEDRGIVEYVPGDLTLTARAGTPLSELFAAVKANGQWLPLDPWGGDSGTIGATVSTASAGPHSYAMGLPRDVVLGMEFVNGKGEVVRSGGRVVKNVAGFDLTRLVIGSWGTLGVVTQVTVRLRARPDHLRTVGIPIPATQPALNELATRLRALPFTPLAAELLSPSLVRLLTAREETLLLARLGGNEKSIAGQLDLLTGLGKPRDMDDGAWRVLRSDDFETTATASWRWSQLPALFGATWMAAHHASRDFEDAHYHGNPMRGVVRVVGRGDVTKFARTTATFHGTSVFERLPESGWSLVNAPEAKDSVSRGLRAKFDPHRILNPGILGGDA
jgi:glycolate oxidase FAD binding subunit